jgi:micrococcal nuclease
VHIRIANIDAPELHGKCDAEIRLAQVAKRRMQELLSCADSQCVTIKPGDPIDGRLTDRYGRTLATLSVVTPEGNKDVGAIMIAEGLARPWTGKRMPWCEWR